MHGDGKASVSASVPYLVNYLNSFNSVADPKADNKGKTPLLPDNAIVHPGSSGLSSWVAPRFGDVKANVDAGWDALSRKAGIGVIIRDLDGTVILSEWKPIHSCMCAEEAEIHAVIVGLKHLIGRRSLSLTVFVWFRLSPARRRIDQGFGVFMRKLGNY